ncbi:MAG: phosphopyruvate hydratase [Nitrososphaerota archaeon]|nr:phosphopyruvate hydratase [Nitrososphaerota archaeon]
MHRKTKTEISDIKAIQVLDSRGNPTIEAELFTKGGYSGHAIVPSGASTGIHEALELRDRVENVFNGKGVLQAVSNVNEIIRPKLIGLNCADQQEIDQTMIELDGTQNKQRLGANAILSVSMAASRAASSAFNEPLYRYLKPREKYRLPIPMMNVINGGRHAGNKLSIQEFLIEPVGAESFSEAVRFGAETYHELKNVLSQKYGSTAVNVGDEGGYAPPFESTRQALESILSAITEAGYKDVVKLGLDPAASSFYDDKDSKYFIDGEKLSSGQLEDYYANLLSSYPMIITLEDPFAEEDYPAFTNITKRFGKRVKIIGDDIYATNKTRIRKGIEMSATNAVLIKLNQIGTVSETIEAINMSEDARFDIVISHRSGETEDVYISHLASAFESSFIKTGAPARGERTAKYNELLRIEAKLGTSALFDNQFLA